MIAYPDTSFLCSAYREQEHSRKADAYRKTMEEPLHFSSLLEFEFIQAIRLQIWLHEHDRRKGYSEREADQMLADWESDVARGINVLVPVDHDAVLRLAVSFRSNNPPKAATAPSMCSTSRRPSISGRAHSSLSTTASGNSPPMPV